MYAHCTPVEGTSANETFDFSFATTCYRVNAKNGNDTIYGSSFGDLLRGQSGDDFVYGGDGTDRVEGGLGDDVVSGGAGDDTVYGGGNASGEGNLIIGGQGDDKMFGGGAGDVFDTVFGDDIVTGNGGADVFWARMFFNDTYDVDTSGQVMRVRDFDATEGDKIRLGNADVDDTIHINAVTMDGADMVIEWTISETSTLGGTIILDDVSVGEISQSDFEVEGAGSITFDDGLIL